MTPNDPLYSFQWNFYNPVYGGINMPSAWDKSQGQGVIVAVVDTGVAYENYAGKYAQAPDLANTNFVPGWDFVNNDSHPNDDEGHGTHVTGTIAQNTNNSLGVAGIAFKASIMPVKVLDQNGSGTYVQVADGIRYAADHGAKVINLSLGGPTPDAYLEAALSYAYNLGVTIVAASGNDSASSVSYPAAYDAYVIAVGATRYDEQKAYYSNSGSSLVGWGRVDANAAVPNLSITLTSDGVVSFGSVNLGSTTSTPSGSQETVRVDAGPANLSIRSTDFSDGVNHWLLSNSSGSEQVKWDFSADNAAWNTFLTAGLNYTLATNAAGGAQQPVYFRLSMPTNTVSNNQHSAQATIVASSP